MIDLVLASVIIALIVERYFYARDMNRQVNDNMKALMAKTPEDYIHMKAVEGKKPSKPVEVDEQPIEQVSDKDFLKALKGGLDG